MNEFNFDAKISEDFQFVINALLHNTQTQNIVWQCNCYYLWYLASDKTLEPTEIMNVIGFSTVFKNLKIIVSVNSFLRTAQVHNEKNLSDISISIIPQQQPSNKPTEHSAIVSNRFNRNSQLELLLSLIFNSSFSSTDMQNIENNVKNFNKDIKDQYEHDECVEELIKFSQQAIINQAWDSFCLRAISND